MLIEGVAQFVSDYVRKRCAEFTPKITALEDKVKDLENKLENALALNKRFAELEREHAAQVALNEAKRGAKGERGARGERGERGPRGERGLAGPPAVMPKLVSTKINEHFNLSVLRSDGSLEIIPLRKAFERYHAEVNGLLRMTPIAERASVAADPKK